MKAFDATRHYFDRAADQMDLTDNMRRLLLTPKREVTVQIAVESRAAAFATHVEQIEAGQFPARPKHPGECQYCRYSGVCRKEYSPATDVATEAEE